MAIWNQEHSEELARRLKEMGFNFAMIPLYKGGGLKAERPSMDDARTFTQICHRLGIRVGCYSSSGTILYETMLAEHPEAKDWLTLDRSGKSVTWGPLYYRYWANRIHPGFRAILREVVHFAVVEAKVDLVHFDNYVMGPSYEPYSVNEFREYLKKKYSPEELARRFGYAEVDYMQPPPAASHPGPVQWRPALSGLHRFPLRNDGPHFSRTRRLWALAESRNRHGIQRGRI